MNGMQENSKTPMMAPNQDQPVRCITATRLRGSDKRPKAANNRPTVEPRRPVIKERNALILLGLYDGDAGCSGGVGRGAGAGPTRAGKPRGGGVGCVGIGRGVGAGVVGKFGPRGA
jgi:hypothetical protein